MRGTIMHQSKVSVVSISKNARKLAHGAQIAAFALLSLQSTFAQVEPKAGTWRTWVVPSVSQVRLPAPPTAAETQAVKNLLAEGNDTTRAQIAYWDAGSPGYRWEQIAAQQML